MSLIGPRAQREIAEVIRRDRERGPRQTPAYGRRRETDELRPFEQFLAVIFGRRNQFLGINQTPLPNRWFYGWLEVKALIHHPWWEKFDPEGAAKPRSSLIGGPLEDEVLNMEDPPPPTSDYFASPGLNSVEQNNPGTGILSGGVDTSGPGYPPGFALRPIQGRYVEYDPDEQIQTWPTDDGVLVIMTLLGPPNAKLAWFTLANHHDGTCEEEPAP